MKPDEDFAPVLVLIKSSFAFMDGRIAPPSSAHRLTVADLARSAAAGEVWQGEAWVRRAVGEALPCALSVSAVRTDVTAAGADAAGVEIPADINVLAEYPIATTSEVTNAEGAQAFIDFVLSEQGQKILQSYGFLEA